MEYDRKSIETHTYQHGNITLCDHSKIHAADTRTASGSFGIEKAKALGYVNEPLNGVDIMEFVCVCVLTIKTLQQKTEKGVNCVKREYIDIDIT